MPDRTTPIRLTHVITGLGMGGAEVMLYSLLSRLDLARFPSEVVSLTEDGPVGEKIRGLGVPVTALRMGRRPLRGFWRLRRLLRDGAPDVVHTWMYHADLVAGLAARTAGKIPVLWAIHNSTLHPSTSRWSTRRIAGLLAVLSRRLPARIVSCSAAARDLHVRMGYAADRFAVIPNGYDLDRFRPDAAARDEARRALGLDSQSLLAGRAGRFHPQKDHETFFRAAGLLKDRFPSLRFALWGEGVVPGNGVLAGWIRAAGLEGRVHLLGPRDDAPRLTAALDVAVSSSSEGEAFPLVVGEAMACGVPCVVTDVGDSAFLAGGAGQAVPPRDPSALAAAIESILSLSAPERLRLGLAARERVERHFSLPAIARRYEALYRETADAARRR